MGRQDLQSRIIGSWRLGSKYLVFRVREEEAEAQGTRMVTV